MFDFLSMMDNYEDRKVARFESDDLIVDTAAVTDSKQPFETAISHPAYHDSSWVIVEMYESKEDAQTGHERWVAIMTADELPEHLAEIGTSFLGEMLGETIYPKENSERTK